MPAFRLSYSEFSRALKPNNSTSIEIVGFGFARASLSLLVIALILVVSTVASLIKSKRDPSAVAHAGRVTASKDGH